MSPLVRIPCPRCRQPVVPGSPRLLPAVAVQGRGCGQVTFIPTQQHPSACQVPRETPRLGSTSTGDLLAGFVLIHRDAS